MPDNKYFIQLNILFVFYIKLFFSLHHLYETHLTSTQVFIAIGNTDIYVYIIYIA